MDSKLLSKLIQSLRGKSDEVLNAVDTAEKAVNLTPEARQVYLEALDKTYGPKDSRISEMGFNKNKWYHGTKSEFDEFDTNKMAAAGYGSYFAKNPDLSSSYSSGYGGRTMPVYLKDNLKSKIDPKILQKIHSSKLSAQMEPEDIVKIIKPDSYTRANQADLIDNLIYREYDKNVPAFGRDLTKENVSGKLIQDFEGDPDAIAKIYDPSNIRSVHAAFDPRFASSSKIMAGFAAMPSMNPLDNLRKFVDKYREVQGPLADKITEQVSKPFGGADEGLKTLGRMAFDPLNIGAAGDIMGAIELLTPEQKKEKLVKTMEKK